MWHKTYCTNTLITVMWHKTYFYCIYNFDALDFYIIYHAIKIIIYIYAIQQ